MKILKRALIVIGSLLLAGAVAVGGLFAFQAYKNAHYYDFVESDQPIEQRFTAMGPAEVVALDVPDSADVPAQKIWYPAELESGDAVYPVVVFANGTGTPASSYAAVFEHLASWGFIAVGNEDEEPRTGESTLGSLDYVLALNADEESPLFGKIDEDNIGVAGQSQGGVGAINAATARGGETPFAAIFTASATSPYWGQEDVFGTDWSYDTSLLTIPTFMVAGTGSFDAGTATDITATEGQGITPLWALQETYAAIPESVEKVIARRTETEHAESMTRSDGYMTAWFRYWLQGDTDAREVFRGDQAEITHNSNWQDLTKNF